MKDLGFERPLYILPARAQVEADVWKIEGLDRHEDCEKIVDAARRGGRYNVGCIVLGRGEDEKKVREWLTTAARVPGFIGFDSLVNWRAKKLMREGAAAEIARRFEEFVGIFEKAAIQVLSERRLQCRWE